MPELSKNKPPSIFDYATKELSQDAMICWLIAWRAEVKAGYRRMKNCDVVAFGLFAPCSIIRGT